jgi:hypothetical protein
MTKDELIAHLLASGDDGRAYLKRYTPEFVEESLAVFANMLGVYIAFTEDSSEPIDIAGRRIAVYTDVLWCRLRTWSIVECDMLAWVTRTLMETYFWATFVTASSENAQTFISDAEVEQRELFEVFLKQQGDYSDVGHRAIRALVETTPSERKHLKPRDQDDPLLYKECSKYVHVSAWLINDYEHRMKDEYSRLSFVAFSLRYFAAVTRLLVTSNAETKPLLDDDADVTVV